MNLLLLNFVYCLFYKYLYKNVAIRSKKLFFSLMHLFKVWIILMLTFDLWQWPVISDLNILPLTSDLNLCWPVTSDLNMLPSTSDLDLCSLTLVTV